MAEVVPEGTPPSNRGLWILVIGLGIAILVVVAAMIGMAIRNAYFGSKTGEPATTAVTAVPGEAPALSVNLEPGASVAESRMDGGNLVVRVTSPTGDEIFVIDPAQAKVVARVKLNKAPAPSSPEAGPP